MKRWVIALDSENIEHLRGHGVSKFPALLPRDVALQEEIYGVRWNHPHKGRRIIDGLTFHAYRSRDPLARQACFWSHYHLWRRCVFDAAPTMILESDAVFTRPFDPAELDGCPFGMVSVNDPRGATRMPKSYHAMLQASRPMFGREIAEVPAIDVHEIPQGLPGHSAYVLQPWFAQELIDKVLELGAMPNDALANRQWFPRKLGCLTNYATVVSGRPSTLS